VILRHVEAAVASLGSDAVFTIEASGHLLEYTWQKQDGVSVLQNARFEGVTTDTMVIRDLQLGDAGTYEVTVSNMAGTAQSSATLTVGEEIKNNLEVLILMMAWNLVFFSH